LLQDNPAEHEIPDTPVKINDLDRLLPWMWKAERDAALTAKARAA
jgi:hypothetical protein